MSAQGSECTMQGVNFAPVQTPSWRSATHRGLSVSPVLADDPLRADRFQPNSDGLQSISFLLLVAMPGARCVLATSSDALFLLASFC